MTKPTDPLSDRAGAVDAARAHAEELARLVAVALGDPEPRLRFEDELARGGMGAVCYAFDAALQRRMAVKTLHAESYEHLMLVRGFLREAQVTGQLDHPNIVPIHELGRDEHGELFFTMKLVDGDSLRAVLMRVCDALAFAHSRGVIHCDIKAANVMVGTYGQVYLMDWGAARLLEPGPGVDASQWVRDSLPPFEEPRGLVFGTPAYMSPEQASRGQQSLDERSDIFSLGALLYEIMTGKPPYSGGTTREGLARAAQWDLVPPEERPHVYPRELIRIAMTAMARDPGDRYQTVEELQDAVDGVLSGGGNFPTMRVPAGVHVIQEGDVGEAAYWIESGTFEVYQLRDGLRKSVRVLGRNTFFGETAIFARTTRTASVVAQTDGVLKVFTASALEEQLDTMTPWMCSLIQSMAKWFAGPEPARRAAKVEPREEAAPADPSVTEFYPQPGPASGDAAEVVTDRGWTGLVAAEASVAIDFVDESDLVYEAPDLAEGEGDPRATQTHPWRRRS
jgi:hypothetical protein